MATKHTKPKQKKHGTDWASVKLEFINGSMTYEQLAEQFGINVNAVKAQGARGKWMDERNRLQQELTKNAQIERSKKKQDELERINEADISIANGLRNQIIDALKATKDREEGGKKVKGEKLQPKELRSLAGAAVEAQKLSRLAIGAPTEQVVNEHSGPGGGPMQSEVFLTDAQRTAADEILDAFINEKQTPTT